MFDNKQSKISDKIVTGTSHLIGRTPKRITTFRDSYNDYLLIECDDGQRVVLIGNKSETIRLPNLDPKEMKQSGFYTDSEIETKVKFIENKKRRDEQDRIDAKKRELEKLTKELSAK